MTWYYCSFANNDEFLGSVVVQAQTIEGATIKAEMLGINPGGEALVYELDERHLPDESYRNRLLTRDECEAAWPGQMVTGKEAKKIIAEALGATPTSIFGAPKEDKYLN